MESRLAPCLGQMLPGPTGFLLLCSGTWRFLGWWDTACLRANFKQMFLYRGLDSLNMNYCTDWSKVGFIWSQLELKGHLLRGAWAALETS